MTPKTQSQQLSVVSQPKRMMAQCATSGPMIATKVKENNLLATDTRTAPAPKSKENKKNNPNFNFFPITPTFDCEQYGLR